MAAHRNLQNNFSSASSITYTFIVNLKWDVIENIPFFTSYTCFLSKLSNVNLKSCRFLSNFFTNEFINLKIQTPYHHPVPKSLLNAMHYSLLLYFFSWKPAEFLSKFLLPLPLLPLLLLLFSS